MKINKSQLIKLVFLTCILVLCFKVCAETTSTSQEASPTKKSLEEILQNAKNSLQQKTTTSSIPTKTAEVVEKVQTTTTKTINKIEETIMMKSEQINEVKKEQGVLDTFVLMQTEKGDIKIKLFMKEAPITAGNFKDLVERKFYNGLIFHRVIPGFVIQGGCPLGNGTGNFIDPATKQTRYIKHEMPDGLRHNKAGIVAMARTADPNSASSQFFIDLSPLPSLDPGGVDPYGYAIFGEVVEGMDVVQKIAKENIPPYPGSDASANPVKMLSVSVVE